MIVSHSITHIWSWYLHHFVLDDERWEDAEEEEEEEDYESEEENPLPSASKYPPSKAQRVEDEKFKKWLSKTKESTI